jgi:flavin reductase (DIM6/NTAB) family NADH-FMN oxidoreductase RutF
MTHVDPTIVRAAHRMFPTGVTVVTAMSPAGPRGLAVNAFSSVSLDPPSVLVCVSRTSRSCESLVAADVIGVNLLAATQEDVARVFASRESDKFAHISWAPGPAGAPLLDGTSAHFEIAPTDIAIATTHLVIIGEVVSCAASDRPPLLYIGGAFHDTAPFAAPPAIKEASTS